MMSIVSEYNQMMEEELERSNRFEELMCDEDNFYIISFLYERFLITPQEAINDIYSNI